MVERQIEIINRLGLHARAAAKLVHLSNRFQSRITIQKDGQEVDGKSILGLLLLAAAHGSQIVIRCDGEDESEAIEALAELVALRFEEKS